MVKGFVMAAAVMLGGIVHAWADLCFEDSAGVLLVAKGFSIPGKGQCNPLNGYLAESRVMVTGGACGTSNTGEIFVTLTLGVGSLSNGSSANVDLLRSSLSGTIRYCTFAYECTNRSITKVACPALRPFGP
jgi:hypothetical protein